METLIGVHITIHHTEMTVCVCAVIAWRFFLVAEESVLIVDCSVLRGMCVFIFRRVLSGLLREFWYED